MPLSLHNLSKNLDNHSVLRGVSFTVRDGEIFGIFGPSSAGKTTLISLIAGKQQPDTGTVFHNDTEITHLTCDERPCHFPILSNQSVWRSLFRTERSSELADGEGQFIALRSALERSSDVLLLDNSFCDMDKLTRQTAFEDLVRTTVDKNLAVVFATNDYEEILLTCDRVGVLIEGEMRQIGDPKEVYEAPADVGVAKVVGSNNFISARRLTSSKAEMPEYQTLLGEHRLFAQKIERSGLAPINQNVTLGIRPEHVSISFGASFPEDNILRATVTRIRFLGAKTLVEFDADGLVIEAYVLRLVGLNVGDECMVGLPPDRLTIFKD